MRTIKTTVLGEPERCNKLKNDDPERLAGAGREGITSTEFRRVVWQRYPKRRVW